MYIHSIFHFIKRTTIWYCFWCIPAWVALSNGSPECRFGYPARQGSPSNHPQVGSFSAGKPSVFGTIIFVKCPWMSNRHHYMDKRHAPTCTPKLAADPVISTIFWIINPYQPLSSVWHAWFINGAYRESSSTLYPQSSGRGCHRLWMYPVESGDQLVPGLESSQVDARLDFLVD